jgi:hypothetical protein
LYILIFKFFNSNWEDRLLLLLPPLWSSGQSSWLQIRRSRVRFPGTKREKKVVGLEWGPLSLVSTTEELLGRNSSGSGLEIREYGRRDSSPSIRKKLALTSLTSGGRSVGIVRLRTEATFFFVLVRLEKENKTT